MGYTMVLSDNLIRCPIRVRGGVGMKEFFSKVPVPICGLSLGLASLDRFLWYIYPDIYKFNIFALFSLCIVLTFTIRIVIDGKGILKDIQTPAVFGVLPTYTMTLMLLSAYVQDHIGGIPGDAAFAVWISAIVVSYGLMIFFVKNAFFRFDMEKVSPSWMIVFVGYVVASVTCTSFGAEEIGKTVFWSGFFGGLIMFSLTAYRVLVVRKIPAHLFPMLAIFAAPMNLCVAGCLAAYGGAPGGLTATALMIAAALGTVSYVVVIVHLPIMLNRGFHPSFAAMTFPLVISAVAFYRLGDYFSISSNDIFRILQPLTVMIALAVVVYVLIRYVVFMVNISRTQ